MTQNNKQCKIFELCVTYKKQQYLCWYLIKQQLQICQHKLLQILKKYIFQNIKARDKEQKDVFVPINIDNIFLQFHNLSNLFDYCHMSATQKSKTNSWSGIMKQQIKDIKEALVELSDDQDIPVEVRPPQPQPNAQKPKEKTKLDFYLNRKLFRTIDKPINLVQQRKPASSNHQVHVINDDISHKNVNSGLIQKQTKEMSKSGTEVINLEQNSQKKQNLETYKKKMFGANYKQTKLPASISVRNNDNKVQKQIKMIDQINKPQWVRQKEERKTINRQKYPISNTYSYDFSNFGKATKFSGLTSQSDRQHQNYLQKRQQEKQKNKQKREAQKIKKKQEFQERKKKKTQKLHAEYEQVLNNLFVCKPQKKVKPNQDLNDDENDGNEGNDGNEQKDGNEENEEAPLANKQALQVVVPEQQNRQQVQEIDCKRRQNRVGAKDTILYQSTAPNLINMILKHNYGEDISKLQTKKLPDIFTDISTYQKTFHYLISNQSIAQITHKLRTIQKNAQDPLKVVIESIDSNVDGNVQIGLYQKESKYSTCFQLKNYSLSRNRIGLICSSREYRKQYYGAPSKVKNQFAFLVLLVTPTNNKEANAEVRADTKVKASILEDLLNQRGKRQVYFFDLEKLSTILRQYLAISNIICSDLSNSVLDPSQVEKQVGNFIKNQGILDNIMNYLKEIFNQTQWQSIREMVLREKGFVLLQGPPGTGKTSTLMGLLSAQYELLKKTNNNRKIMICAPSNAAVDHIAKRIINEGLVTGQGEIVHPIILRTGIVDTQDESVKSVSLDLQCEKEIMLKMEQSKITNSLSTPQIKQKIILLQKEMRQLLKRQKKTEFEAKKQQLKKYEEMLYEFKRFKFITSKANYNAIQDKLLQRAEIVLTTLASAGNDKIDKIRGQIAVLIVDQAAQATEPNLLIALQTGVQKVILIGDPYQLPATVISPDANVTLFNRSLFQRFLDANIKPYFLNIQYRMHPVIRAFPSSRFYHDRLIDAQSIIHRPIPLYLRNFEGRNAIFIDLKYGQDERKGDSFCNYAQAKVISLLIHCLIDTSVSIGLITPYQAQKRVIFGECMQALQQKQQQQQYFQKQVMINTVDSFQGQEKDIIIVSTVRGNSNYNVGFLTDQRRINVTLTRAKHLMIVIGSANTLGSNEVWDDFLSWTEARKCYYQVTSQREMGSSLGNLFQNFNQQKIRRIRHKKLSTDVRNISRNEIQSKDFRLKKQVQKQKYLKYREKRENPSLMNQPYYQKLSHNQEAVKNSKKYAMDINESQQILKEKRMKQEEQRKFNEMLQRMKKLEEQNIEDKFF